ncbi:DUF3572 domain-containing protein [Thalassospira sp.]|uniref:DUF3572 domain-containing protein n=1 Tax=Thalassospira sp. TaxID=1912094 RepID=UPI0027349F39|nr:DUF3572 domain-containing protein [Thalassospira sp.]MDP2698870.1 DUF3572 domain-containing protein [Thalassospira sp.]
MNRDAAETVAIQAIAHVVGDDDLLQGLLAQTGMDLTDLREGIGTIGVQVGVLDFLLSHEPFLMGFVEAIGCSPETPARAQMVLSGGPVWQD